MVEKVKKIPKNPFTIIAGRKNEETGLIDTYNIGSVRFAGAINNFTHDPGIYVQGRCQSGVTFKDCVLIHLMAFEKLYSSDKEKIKNSKIGEKIELGNNTRIKKTDKGYAITVKTAKQYFILFPRNELKMFLDKLIETGLIVKETTTQTKRVTYSFGFKTPPKPKFDY